MNEWLPHQFNLETDYEYLCRLVGVLMNYKTQAMNRDMGRDDMISIIALYEYITQHDSDETHRKYIVDNYGPLVSKARNVLNDPAARIIWEAING